MSAAAAVRDVRRATLKVDLLCATRHHALKKRKVPMPGINIRVASLTTRRLTLV
jgi:hypothetical protein